MIVPYWKTLGVTAAVLVTSCQSATTRFFTLEPVAPASMAGSYSGPPIRIDAVHIPPALDRIEIARDGGAGELKVSDLDHWSAPLGQLARDALTADLIARLPPGRAIFPQLAKPEDAFGVNVDILQFSFHRNQVRLQASWSIASERASLRSSRNSAVLETESTSASPTALAQSLSALLAQLADRIVADLLLWEPVHPTAVDAPPHR